MVGNDKSGSRERGDRFDINRRSFLTATSASSLAVTAGCLGGDDDHDGIRIGGLFPQPGQNPGGTGMQQATEVLVENLNEKGGLLDEEVELVTRDTELDPATARNAYRELVLEEEVDVTTGVYSTEVGMAILDEVPEFGTIHLTGGTAPDGPIEDHDYEYWFRALHGEYLGRSTGGYIAEHFEELGITDIGIVAEDVDGFGPVMDGLEESLPDFVTVHFEEWFSSDTTDFSPLLDQGESDDIQMMIAFTSLNDALMTQWAQREPNYMFGGGDVPSSNPSRWADTDGDVEYVWSYIGGSGPGIEINETTEQLIDDHREMFDGDVPPHAQAYTQYDAILTWVETVEEVGTTDEDEVAATITELTIEGATGTLEWHDDDGEFPHTPRFGEDYFHPPVMQWQENDGEGEQVGLYPDSVHQGELEVPSWVEL